MATEWVRLSEFFAACFIACVLAFALVMWWWDR
jgi:hypothetical protein